MARAQFACSQDQIPSCSVRVYHYMEHKTVPFALVSVGAVHLQKFKGERFMLAASKAVSCKLAENCALGYRVKKV